MNKDQLLARHVNKTWPGEQDTIADHIRREARAIVIVDALLQTLWEQVHDELKAIGEPTGIPGMYACGPEQVPQIMELSAVASVLHEAGDTIHAAAKLAGLTPEDRDTIKADLERERAALALLGGFEGNESR